MSNIVKFPRQDCMIISEKMDSSARKPIFIIEYLSGGERTLISRHQSKLEANEAALKWLDLGIMTDGGAA